MTTVASRAPTSSDIVAAIFDFAGVLTGPMFRGRECPDPAMLGLVGFLLQETAGVYHLPTGSHDIHLLETGRMTDRDFFTRLCERHAAAGNPRVDPSEAREYLFERPLAPCPEMVAAVRELRSAGYRTALITNAAPAQVPMWRRVLPDPDLFDTVVDSSAVGLRKPDPRIYRLACARLEVEPARCLFVDDLACNVDAACEVGMQTILCADPVATAAELGRLLLPRTDAAAV